MVDEGTLVYIVDVGTLMINLSPFVIIVKKNWALFSVQFVNKVKLKMSFFTFYYNFCINFKYNCKIF